MKKILVYIFALGLFLTACKKEEIIVDNTPVVVTETQKTLLTGSFVSNDHPTSGIAKIVQDTDGKKYLVMENLKSDAGPDLRIYLSQDKTIKSAVQILAKVPGGNSKTLLPSDVDISKQKTILIWCKQFSVLFGNAELK
jgi:Electron transfer DM13